MSIENIENLSLVIDCPEESGGKVAREAVAVAELPGSFFASLWRRVGRPASQPLYHLTEWKLLIMKDVTGCCHFVADLLPIKCLIINDVTDVATFKSIASKEMQKSELKIKNMAERERKVRILIRVNPTESK